MDHVLDLGAVEGDEDRVVLALEAEGEHAPREEVLELDERRLALLRVGASRSSAPANSARESSRCRLGVREPLARRADEGAVDPLALVAPVRDAAQVDEVAELGERHAEDVAGPAEAW